MEEILGWVVAGSGLVDLLVAISMLWLGSKREATGGQRLGLLGVLIAVGVTTLIFAIKAAGLLRLGMGLFGLIHLAYVDIVIVVPLLGLILLIAEFATWRKQSGWRLTNLVRGLAGVSLLGVWVGWYATFWEPFNLQVETASSSLSSDRMGRAPIKIGVLTDLQTVHVTDYERGAVERLLALKPDMILLPGDIFQGSDESLERELAGLHELLMKLDAPFGVYYAPGDVDQGSGRVERIFDGTKVKPLINDLITVEVHDRRVTIGGVELQYASPAARELVKRLEDRPRTDDVRILLGHRPDAVFNLEKDSRIDLVVAGHTHGGQVVIPGFGPLMTLSDVPRRVAAGGLNRLNGNEIYVSRGVGCERAEAPRIRFFCPPEISILTLGKAE